MCPTTQCRRIYPSHIPFSLSLSLSPSVISPYPSFLSYTPTLSPFFPHPPNLFLISTGSVPQDWLTTDVVPKPRSHPGNYRPVRLTLIVGK
ncbi:hypothetical protein FKM82_021233 [Ascaphus truei]